MVWIQTLFSFIGFLAGCFALYDRFSKQWPVFTIETLPLAGFGVPTPYLRVTNRSDRAVVVVWDGDTAPGELTLFQGHSTSDAARYLQGGQQEIDVSPNEIKLLPIAKPGNFDDLAPDYMMHLNLRWRFVHGALLKRNIPRAIQITKADFNLLLGSHSQ